MTQSDQPTRGSESELPVDCSRHSAAIEDLLATSRIESTPAADAFSRHRESCEPCSEAWDSARRLDAAIPRWIVPDPPSGFRDRVLTALLRTASDHDCGSFLSRLEAYRAGDLGPELRGDCERHLAVCESCTAELHVAARVDDALRSLRAPSPGPSFTSRILLELEASGLARALSEPVSDQRPLPVATHARRVSSRSTGRSLAASAILALAAALLVVAAPTTSPPPSPIPTAPGSDVAATGRSTLLRAVSDEARPASIGSFAGSPRRVDRFARSGGNLFHRSLKQAKLEWIAADSLDARARSRAR